MKRGLVVGLCVLALASPSAGMVGRAAAQADESSDTDARSWFDKGRAAYEAGNFDEAARAFRRAYVLSPRFALLYNIGQAELRAGRDQLAIDAFEGYLRQAPADDPRRSEVQERARVLHSMGVRASDAPTSDPGGAPAATAATTASTTETTPEPVAPDAATATTAEPDAGGSGNIVPWMIVAGGGAVVVGGVVMMMVGLSKSSNVTDAPDGTRWADIKGDADSANVFWGIGLGMATVGLAASGVGLVWALGGDSSEDASAAGATARVHVGVGNVLLEGAF